MVSKIFKVLSNYLPNKYKYPFTKIVYEESQGCMSLFYDYLVNLKAAKLTFISSISSPSTKPPATGSFSGEHEK